MRRESGKWAAWRLSWEARRHHALAAGASGCGKSTTLRRLALEDAERGRAVVLVDPHGDLAHDLALDLPRQKTTLIDPRLPLTSPLDLLDPDPGRAAAHLMGAVGEVWPADFSGPVWQRGISLSLRALAGRPGRPRTTLAELERFIVEPSWRGGVVASLADKVLQAEAAFEAANWARSPSGDSSLVTWMAGKLTPLTRGPGAPLFGGPPNRPLEDELAGGTALLVSLPLGTLGPEITRIAGRMLLTRLTTAIAAQGLLPEERRPPLSIYVDEAHLLAGPALAGLFAQTRKFGAAVTVATQSPSQLGSQLPGILTNVQTLLLGRLAMPEALLLLARVGETAAHTLPTLPRHHLLVTGEDQDPAAPPLILSPIAPPPRPDPREREREERRDLVERLAADLHALRARRD